MESMEYEHARNMTLLFFLERLLDKGEPRTLHDLSCQFGARGFTREMRQIAGGSQSGLKKFLSQYPALFIINGDYVHVNPYQKVITENDEGTSGPKKDYIQEAKEYFSNKLIPYGPGTEVPIKSLLGHRSQASPQVRHISGQHIKEFRDFLMKHPDMFKLIDDNVVLVGVASENYPSSDRLHLPTPHIDTDVTQDLLDFFAQCIEIKGPILVDQLFHAVTSKFPQDQWFKVFKTPSDLSTFLKLFSDSFHIQSNLVTLLHKPKLSAAYIHQAAKTNSASDSERKNQQIVNETVTDFKINEPITNSYSLQNSLNTGFSNLYNNCNLNSVNQPPSNENSIQSLPIDATNVPNIQNQTLKQRINNLVIKTLAENMEKDKTTSNCLTGDTWKIKVLQITRLVNTVNDCLLIVTSIIRSGSATDQPVISFDCEGINLGANGQLSLLQICTMKGEVYIFDVLACPALVTKGGLKTLLECEHVIKVIHDCRNDSINLYKQFGITLKNVFDTQAAHAVLQLQEQGKPVYKVKNVSLNALCELYDAPINPMKEQLKNIYRRDQRYWARRPMTRDMLLYAAADVLVLMDDHLYKHMNSAIQAENRNLLQELCSEQVFLHIRPADVKTRKRLRKVQTEVADLKTKLSNSSKNVVLSNREIRLLRYLDLTEEEKDKLKGSYKVAKKLEKLEGIGQYKDVSDSEDDLDNADPESNSLESYSDNSLTGAFSPRTSEPPSLTESMQLMDEIIADNSMDRLLKIEKLEAILSAVTLLPGANSNNAISLTPAISPDKSDLIGDTCTEVNPRKCECNCHISTKSENNVFVNNTMDECSKVDASCQTLSTGDIVITKIFFNEDQVPDKEIRLSPNRIINNSPC
ncbi:egalitarian protein homolog isoform X2 [Ctenocephalides felis]|uniref:egalitarian protein homolog isoform X2 n=1 Tax=Ctenocephalides felis TaxID=7515 RepID=UPI000E6E4E99|nr:egalitarian protein homolog isoform X2 [Ctenocephalides felis]